MATHVREIRGIPLWLLREYLVELGGSADGDRVVGDGWDASIMQLADYQIGSLRVGQVRLAIDGDDDVLSYLKQRLELKLLRGGG